MKNLLSPHPLLGLALLAGAMGGSSVQGSALSHERLRVRNTFKTPEEVVGYYCARDASGFIWSGLLDAERTAFTLWNQAPAQDSFYIASRYQINPSQIIAHNKDHVVVEVKYEISGMGDAMGTRVPANHPEMLVSFDLKRVNGQWKIAKPDPATLAPVVLKSKFQP